MSPVPGEPRETPKVEPIGNSILLSLFTMGTLCLVFILWRRASSLRRVVSHQLKTLRGEPSEGHIRLSTDDYPPSNEFLHDEYDDDNASLGGSDDEPLSEHIRKATQAWREPDVGVGGARRQQQQENATGKIPVMDLGTLRDVQGGFVTGNPTTS